MTDRAGIQRNFDFAVVRLCQIDVFDCKWLAKFAADGGLDCSHVFLPKGCEHGCRSAHRNQPQKRQMARRLALLFQNASPQNQNCQQTADKKQGRNGKRNTGKIDESVLVCERAEADGRDDRADDGPNRAGGRHDT